MVRQWEPCSGNPGGIKNKWWVAVTTPSTSRPSLFGVCQFLHTTILFTSSYPHSRMRACGRITQSSISYSYTRYFSICHVIFRIVPLSWPCRSRDLKTELPAQLFPFLLLQPKPCYVSLQHSKHPFWSAQRDWEHRRSPSQLQLRWLWAPIRHAKWKQ